MLELIAFTVKELKRLNPNLDTEELTVENTISKSFHKILQQELNPIWHQVEVFIECMDSLFFIPW